MTSRARDLAVKDGLELVGIVRDYGVDTITEFVRQRDRHQLEAMAVALAAMVPDDQPVSALLAWIEPPPTPRVLPVPTPRRLPPSVPADSEYGTSWLDDRVRKECGTHTAHNRHTSRGEQPCAACVVGERAYQRDRKRASRAERVA